MIINKAGEIFDYEGVRFAIGATIVGTKQSAYKGMFGVITEIRDGKDKNTENKTPDIYCSFEKPSLRTDVHKLEKVFSNLYGERKKMVDIISNEVIMAPDMIIPLNRMYKDRINKSIFVVLEEWSVNQDSGCAVELYSDKEEAEFILRQKVRNKQHKGCLKDWACKNGFWEEIYDISYGGYFNCGDYYNQYEVKIVKTNIKASPNFIIEVGDFYLSQSRQRDFVSLVHGLKNLSKTQIEMLIHYPNISDLIKNSLDKNEAFSNSYWDCLAEVASELINKENL